ncbi:SusC/RagA family TonB-linked outer membrane protein [Parabacteroides gordonii]|uniref:SusC/RagA family TonB-linked outer membrane protein n=1 Tax=Parabacteroides gordonii TaxID=574930 RepID=UPI0026F0044D|nr:SusC/RagA family TonB-linked outer membrane protein [Parabacteroides gordonii]
MLKNFKPVSFILLVGALCLPKGIYAELVPAKQSTIISQQSGKVTGTVEDDFGPVAGASVVVKGTTNGNITDMDGNFTLEGVKNGDIIQISFIGYSTQEIKYEGQATLSIKLAEDAQKLDEVVVTALGIKREKKALGYAMQELKGDDLVNARETNVANALSGKVSGVQIIRSSNGPGASSKIQLRGSNSVTGLNQPLIVVDGIPMDNFTGGSNNDYWNPSADMGNGLSDINPEDIASMSVLKGASAAALYGSRAGNGVILITTKTGKKSDGLGITISGSVSAETIFMNPKMQDSFGQGTLGVYDALKSSSWGPKITGQSYEKWDGTTANMQAYDNVSNYFDTGTNLTENISFAQQYNNTSVYTSVTRMDDNSKIPGASLARTNLTMRALSKFGKDERWTLDAKIQYINSNAENRPISGDNSSNVFNTIYQLPRSMDIRDFSAARDENGKMIWYGGGQQINPYWSSRYVYNQDVRDRFLMFGSLKYRFTDWLNAEVKAGSDMYFTDFVSKTYAGSSLTNSGRYSIGQDRFYENNYSFLISAQKDNLFGKWGGSATFGGNLMMRQKKKVTASPDELNVPDLFTLGNAKNKINGSEEFNRKKINSFYGTVQANYDGYLFLDATFRNDWSSSLSKKNRSFFYPSVSAAWVVSDMMNKMDKPLPEWFTFAKARVSFAQVGNDMDAYQLYNTYSIGSDPEGNTTVNTKGTLYDENVRSELISSWEAGLEVKFFNNRLGLDLAWYKSNARRQLLNLPMDPLSGYSNKKINAGDIQNTGIELMLNARPIETAGGFTWDLMVNFSKNSNKIIELTPDISLYSLGGYDNVQIYATAGGNYGEIWGTQFKRVTDESSPYYGKMIVTKDGLPTGNTEKVKIGDQQPDALLGITSTFAYKGWSLSFLIDSRFGGEIFSGTNRAMQASGTAAATVVNGERPDMTLDAVFVDDNGAYQPNNSSITTQQYWEAVTGSTGNLGIGEANIYSATNIRLRNLSLNYAFNKQMLSKTPFQQIKLGVSCNNVWMIKSHLNGVDPESVYATSTNATGFENGGSPTSRSYLFNVTLGF